MAGDNARSDWIKVKYICLVGVWLNELKVVRFGVDYDSFLLAPKNFESFK